MFELNVYDHNGLLLGFLSSGTDAASLHRFAHDFNTFAALRGLDMQAEVERIPGDATSDRAVITIPDTCVHTGYAAFDGPMALRRRMTPKGVK